MVVAFNAISVCTISYDDFLVIIVYCTIRLTYHLLISVSAPLDDTDKLVQFYEMYMICTIIAITIN